MFQCKCKKTSNGYFQWECANLKCKDCKNIKPAPLISQMCEEIVKVFQFELSKTPYTEVDKNRNSIKKISKKTDRAEKR